MNNLKWGILLGCAKQGEQKQQQQVEEEEHQHPKKKPL